MIVVPEITIEKIAVAEGHGESLRDLALRSIKVLLESNSVTDSNGLQTTLIDSIGGVLVASFSNERRFPSLAVEIASALGLPPTTPAFDLQMACSAYPYAVYLGGRIAADTGKKVLIVDGDVQSRLVDAADHDTGSIFSDAVTASLVSSGVSAPSPTRQSYFDFFSKFDSAALSCSETGPIKMKGFDVFSFVATDVVKFMRDFLAASGSAQNLRPSTSDVQPSTFNLQPFFFVPHQANPYMVRQLAKSLGLEDRLLTLDESKKNPGSCSIPMTLAAHPECRGHRVLLAGFGAGYSAAAAIVKYAGI